MHYDLHCGKKIIIFFATLVTISILLFHPSFAGDREKCNEIARQVEFKNGLPKNILASIALVEAGRRYSDGSVSPWPWSLNHAGKSLFFNHKIEALEYLNRYVTASFKNIDVGCMQINVKWHGEKFDSFSTMLDPLNNVEYAATFLSNLKRIHGSWKEAIKHYHSATSRLNVKYYAKVEKVWNNKTPSKAFVQEAALSVNGNTRFPLKRNSNNQLIDTNIKKNIDETDKAVLKFLQPDVKNQDNQIYLNAVLIDNNKMYNKEELKRYINYKSAYLGKNIDMILLFREEFSKN